MLIVEDSLWIGWHCAIPQRVVPATSASAMLVGRKPYQSCHPFRFCVQTGVRPRSVAASLKTQKRPAAVRPPGGYYYGRKIMCATGPPDSTFQNSDDLGCSCHHPKSASRGKRGDSRVVITEGFAQHLLSVLA